MEREVLPGSEGHERSNLGEEGLQGDGYETARNLDEMGQCTGEREVTWAELWKGKPYQIQFPAWKVSEMLPCLANLQTWGKEDSPVSSKVIKISEQSLARDSEHWVLKDKRGGKL